MGENADFFSGEGIADPALVKRLRGLPSPPVDPERLARFIDGIAGVDLDLRLVGFEARRRETRRKALTGLRGIQKQAKVLCDLDVEPNLEILELAISDLVPSSPRGETSTAERVVQAIRLLAEIPLFRGASAQARKPPTDEAASRIVLAVGAYFKSRGEPFSGVPRREWADGKYDHNIKSDFAVLSAAVLNLFQIEHTSAQLSTLIRKAQAWLRTKSPS